MMRLASFVVSVPHRCAAYCLGCEEQIPVWDKVCGECGGKQSALIASRLDELQQQLNTAEKLRSEYGYEAALQIAQGIVAIDDVRLSQHKPFAEEFVNSTKAEWEGEKESARMHFEESQKHREAFDYTAAIHSIQAIPEPMRSAEVSFTPGAI